MAHVDKTTGYLNRQRQFVDDDRGASVGVGIIDGVGDITGTASNPIRTSSPSQIDLLGMILLELKALRMAISEATDSDFRISDTEGL